MTIIQRVPWRVQPPIGVPLDSAWLSRGLVAFFDTAQAKELISGDRATTDSTTKVVGRFGRTAQFGGANHQRYAHRAAYATTGKMTLVALIENASTAAQSVIEKGVIAAEGCPYWWVLAGTNTGGIDLWRGGTGGTYGGDATAGSLISSTYSGVLAHTAPAGSIVSASDLAYINGSAVTTSNVANSAGDKTPTDTGASDVWIGRRNNNSTNYLGKISFIALFNTELTAGELNRLYVNPWQLFAPLPRHIWAAAAAGPPPTFIPSWAYRKTRTIGAGVI